jgi:hypothetical protein
VKRPSERPNHRRQEDNIKMDLKERWGRLDSSGSGKEPVVSSSEQNNKPSGFRKGSEFLDQPRLSGRTLLNEVSLLDQNYHKTAKY